MNKGRRLVAGAATACALLAPTAAVADSSPGPAQAPGVPNPGDPTTTVPLPDGLAQCLISHGFPIPSAGAEIAVPTPPPPTNLSGTISLPAAGTPVSIGTIPLTAIDGVTAGSNPLPEGAVTGALQCGQMIVNNTVYWVIVTPTTTTTTTTTTADGPIAAGPVSVAPAPAPAPAPVANPAPIRGQATPRRPRKHHSKVRKHSMRHKAHRVARRGKPVLRIALVRTGRGAASR